MALATDVKSIDKKTRTIEMEDGRKMPLPDDLAYEFFGSKASKDKAQGYKEAIGDTHSLLKNVAGGEFAVPYASNHMKTDYWASLGDSFLTHATEAIPSLTAGEGQEDMGYFSRLGENVIANQKGRREGGNEISKDYPKTSVLGQVGGFATSLAAPAPSNMAVQGGLMGAGLSHNNLLDNPMGLAKDVAIDSAIGFGFGKTGSWLERMAAERGALRAHPERLAQHAAETAQERARYISEMDRKLGAVDSELRGGVSKSSLLIDDFVNNSINLSPIANTAQGNSLTRFFKSIENALPESMNSTEFRRVFATIEQKLATAAPEEAAILSNFREHLVKNIPIGAAQNAVRTKFGTRIMNGFEKEVEKLVTKFTGDAGISNAVTKNVGVNSLNGLSADIRTFVRKAYDKMSPAEFARELENGNLHNKVMTFFDTNPRIVRLKKGIEDAALNIHRNKPMSNLRSPEARNLIKAKDELQAMRDGLSRNLNNSISSNQLPAQIYQMDVAQKVSSKVSNAVGIQNPLTAARPPTNSLPAITPAPSAPQVGKMASFFERPDFYTQGLQKLASLKGGSGMAKLGYLFKGLPKAGVTAIAGTAAAGLTSALRGLTSPTALGAYARQGIQQGGMRLVVESIADKYPSYNNGVLTDPQDRRSATAEIEQDQDIGLEDKAMLQAKINRGQSIEPLVKE